MVGPDTPIKLALRFGLRNGGEEHGLGDVGLGLDPGATSLIQLEPLGVLRSLALRKAPKDLLVNIDDTVPRIFGAPQLLQLFRCAFEPH